MGGRSIPMIWVLSAAFSFLFIPSASAVSVTQTEGFSTGMIWPLLVALSVAFLVRRWFIPQQLKKPPSCL